MYLFMCVCVEGFLLIVRIFKANKGKPNIDDVLNANCRLNAKPCPSGIALTNDVRAKQ